MRDVADPVNRLVDLSRLLETGMPVFPGDPPVELAPAGAVPPWQVTRLSLGTHSGTHIDAASHYMPAGRTIDEYPLERFVLDVYVVHLDVGAEAAIAWTDIAAQLPGDLDGAGVLLHTGWDRFWGTAKAERHPSLSQVAAGRLAACGATLVGTDALNVDGTTRPTTFAHAALLGADVLIVENLTGLGALDAGRPYRCSFVPLNVAGGDGSPIRAYAETEWI
jgi:arylformamidase